jgi:hypothetical protein
MAEDANPRPPDDASLIPGKGWLGRKVMLFIAYHTPRCREVVRLASQGLERELPLSMRFKLWAHNLMCCWCQRYMQQLRYLRKTARAFPEQAGASSRAALSAAARHRLKAVLRRGTR